MTWRRRKRPPKDRKKRGYVAKGECHGSRSCYVMGCSNDVCLLIHTRWVKQNRLQRLTTGRLNHGTRSSYDAGCDCPLCTSARVLAYKNETLKALRPVEDS